MNCRFVAALGMLVAVLGGDFYLRAESPQQITAVEGVTEYRLDNGLTVLLAPDPLWSNVTVNVTVLVGSRHEGYGQAGMAHLLEHMLFRGTPTHENIPQSLQSRGADFNANTSSDRMMYYETLPAEGDNLEFAIRLEADRLVNTRIRKQDLAAEMKVVRNEFERTKNRTLSVLHGRMLSAAYQWHNYGKVTIGNQADIEHVAIERLRAFYHEHYRPDNALLIVVGGFEKDRALDLAEEHFGAIERPPEPLQETYTREPPQPGPARVTLKRRSGPPIAALGYHVAAAAHPDFAPLQILTKLLCGSPGGPLYDSLVASGQAANIKGTANPRHDPGMLFFVAEAAQSKNPQRLLDKMIDTLQTVTEKGVSEKQVQRARQRLLRDRDEELADGGEFSAGLGNWAARGDWRLYFLHRDRLEQTSASDVQSVLEKYVTSTNRTAGLAMVTKEPRYVAPPSATNLDTVLADYKGREIAEGPEAFDLSPSAIAKRRSSGISIGRRSRRPSPNCSPAGTLLNPSRALRNNSVPYRIRP